MKRQHSNRIASRMTSLQISTILTITNQYLLKTRACINSRLLLTISRRPRRQLHLISTRSLTTRTYLKRLAFTMRLLRRRQLLLQRNTNKPMTRLILRQLMHLSNQFIRSPNRQHKFTSTVRLRLRTRCQTPLRPLTSFNNTLMSLLRQQNLLRRLNNIQLSSLNNIKHKLENEQVLAKRGRRDNDRDVSRYSDIAQLIRMVGANSK